MESGHGLVVHPQETLGCPLLGHLHRKLSECEYQNLNLSTAINTMFLKQFTTTSERKCRTWTNSDLVLEIPDSIFVGKLFVSGSTLGQNSTLKAAHVEKKVGVVLAVHRDKTLLP